MKLKTLVIAAPADAARAGGIEPVLEIVTFRLIDGADRHAFLDAARGTATLLRERGALTRRFLTVDGDGLWTDVVEWTSMEAALTAAAEVMEHPGFGPFMAMIDPETVTMRHTHILYRME